MNNTVLTSSISLSFNDSWLAHIGSRVYRLAIKVIELLETTFSYPFIQPYSGKRLYQLVDTYHQAKNDKNSYDQARSKYASTIITSLQGEKNIFEKAKRIGAILNTHIIGLSILQDKDKKSLSKHIAYTLLPSQIDEFGANMASKSILALHELDNMVDSKSLNKYAKLYKDITLQQSDLDSFVEALHELNSGVSKDLLIHELLLSRNRNLTEAAKAKITATLKDSHYIAIKVQKKLQLLNQLKDQGQGKELSEDEITLELQSHRDVQLEALDYTGPSMFFDSNDSVIYDYSEIPEATAESASPEMTAQSTKKPSSSEMPVGISNTNQNCWYNSALQIISNTPIYYDILQQSDQFSKDFPKIAASFNLYRDTYAKNSNCLHQLNLNDQMQEIRAEIHNSLDKEFEKDKAEEEDSKHFLDRLLHKLSIDVARVPILGADLFSFENNHILIDKDISQKIDLETLFRDTKYQPYGIILHTGTNNGGHYFAAVKLHKFWYLCNDSLVEKISEERLQSELNKNSALIIASNINKFDPQQLKLQSYAA